MESKSFLGFKVLVGVFYLEHGDYGEIHNFIRINSIPIFNQKFSKIHLDVK